METEPAVTGDGQGGGPSPRGAGQQAGGQRARQAGPGHHHYHLPGLPPPLPGEPLGPGRCSVKQKYPISAYAETWCFTQDWGSHVLLSPGPRPPASLVPARSTGRRGSFHHCSGPWPGGGRVGVRPTSVRTPLSVLQTPNLKTSVSFRPLSWESALPGLRGPSLRVHGRIVTARTAAQCPACLAARARRCSQAQTRRPGGDGNCRAVCCPAPRGAERPARPQHHRGLCSPRGLRPRVPIAHPARPDLPLRPLTWLDTPSRWTPGRSRHRLWDIHEGRGWVAAVAAFGCVPGTRRKGGEDRLCWAQRGGNCGAERGIKAVGRR